jgi:hypothetical protein
MIWKQEFQSRESEGLTILIFADFQINQPDRKEYL